MKRKEWMIIAGGAFAVITLICTVAVFAEEAVPMSEPPPPSAPAPATETNELSELLMLLDGPKWNRFIEDTTQALKERAADEQGRRETAEAIDKGVHTLNEMLKRAVAVADALQHSTDTPEFNAWKERVKQDVESAAQSLQEVDTDGLVKMMDALTKEVVEPMGIVAEQAEEHFGEDAGDEEKEAE